MGIDPVTHKPFAQVFAEYGKISGLPIQNARNHICLPNNTTEISKQLPFSLRENYSTQKYTWDPKAQYQVIHEETLQTHSFSEVSPLISSATYFNPTVFSSSSSYASVQSQVHTTASSSSTSTWNEFVFGDLCTSTDTEQKQEYQLQAGIYLSKDLSNSVHKDNPTCGEVTEVEENQSVEEATCSSAVDSFVDTILARDKQMLMDFPPLLDVYLDY